MNIINKLSPSTFRLVKNIGKILKLRQILLIPIKHNDEVPAILFESDSKTKHDGEVGTKKLLNYLVEKYSKKTILNSKNKLREIFGSFNQFNPYTVQIKKENLHAVMLFDKEIDVEKEWKKEEMEMLDLIGQFVRADLLLNSNKRLDQSVEKLLQQKNSIFETLELQYRLPVVNSLQLLKKAMKQLQSLHFELESEGVSDFDSEIEFYLERSRLLLESADEVVQELQENFWEHSTDNKDTKIIDKVHIEQFMQNYIKKYSSIEAEIYYGQVKPFGKTQNLKIYIRKVLLEKVLNALVDNALKFSKGDTAEIYLTTEVNDVDLILTVRDMGIGIPNDEIENVGNPFFRASNNKHEKGLGFELSIVKRMLSEYGGTLNFRSVEGKYTEVVCNLPYLASDLQDKKII